MKNHASGHGRKGNAGYRTPSTFRSEVQRKFREIKVTKVQDKEFRPFDRSSPA